MKYVSKKEIIAITTIVLILAIFGIKLGFELISKMNPFINLLKIAFAGFISFAIVGIIMAIGSKIGIWFGKFGGSVLYAILLYVIGSLFF